MYDDEVTKAIKALPDVLTTVMTSVQIMAKKFTISNKKNRGPERGPEGDEKRDPGFGYRKGSTFLYRPNCTHLTPVRLQVQLLVPDEVITVKEKQSGI